jgi:hypothetical protein
VNPWHLLTGAEEEMKGGRTEEREEERRKESRSGVILHA